MKVSEKMGFEQRSEKRKEPQDRSEKMRTVIPGRVDSLFQGPKAGTLSRSVRPLCLKGRKEGQEEEPTHIVLA